jgi:hypothetical protein
MCSQTDYKDILCLWSDIFNDRVAAFIPLHQQQRGLVESCVNHQKCGGPWYWEVNNVLL